MNKRYTEHFTYAEMASKDGGAIPMSYIDNMKKLCRILEYIRFILGVPLYIHSAHRSPYHNKQVGGVENSFHIKCMAVDFSAEGYSPIFIYELLVFLSNIGLIPKGGIHYYDNFVHYDFRGYSARW